MKLLWLVYCGQYRILEVEARFLCRQDEQEIGFMDDAYWGLRSSLGFPVKHRSLYFLHTTYSFVFFMHFFDSYTKTTLASFFYYFYKPSLYPRNWQIPYWLLILRIICDEIIHSTMKKWYSFWLFREQRWEVGFKIFLSLTVHLSIILYVNVSSSECYL